ncbi:MAG: ketopantoate reductase family protein [Pontibacterium sp.]
MTSPQTWHLLGAGAIGCLWAAHLTRAGLHTTLILKETHRANWPGHISLCDANATPHETLTVAAATTDQIQPSEIENLLITTKAFDALSAVLPLKPLLSNAKNIVVMINGLGPQQQVLEQLAPHLPKNCRFWAASTTNGAWCPARFQVVEAGIGLTTFGKLSLNKNHSITSDGDDSPPQLPFDAQGISLPCKAVTNIGTVLWRKLAINCAINPLTAINQVRNGQLAEQPELTKQMRTVCEEVEAVAHGLKLSLFDSQFKAPLFDRAVEVAIATGANYSSMYQDVLHKRPTEVDVMTGYLLAQARLLNIDCPQNQSLFEQVKHLEDTKQ